MTPFQWADYAASATTKGQYAEACGFYRLAIRAQKEQADGDPEYWVSIWTGCIMALENVMQRETVPLRHSETPSIHPSS